MLDRGPRHAGVAAGQHLPHLVDAELREHLTLACGVANPRHTILTIAAEKLTPATGPAGQTQVLIAADTPVGGYDPVIADPHGLAAKRFGLRAGRSRGGAARRLYRCGRRARRPARSGRRAGHVRRPDERFEKLGIPSSDIQCSRQRDRHVGRQPGGWVRAGVNVPAFDRPGTGHCAMSKAPEIVPMLIDGLRRRLA